MALDITEIALLEYTGPQGNIPFENAMSAELTRDYPRNAVKTMNRSRRAIAFQSGVPDFSISTTVKEERVLSGATVDWLQAANTNEVFSIVVEHGINGRREIFQSCVITAVSHSYDAEGDASLDVTISSTNAAIIP